MNRNDFVSDLMDIGLHNAVINSKTTSNGWRDWSNAFNTVGNKHVKIKEIRVKEWSNPWLTKDILALIYRRDYTHRRAVRLGSSMNTKYRKTCQYRNALGTNFYSGLDRFRFREVFTFGGEQTTITCTIHMRVIIQDVSSVGLQMIGGCMQIN